MKSAATNKAVKCVILDILERCLALGMASTEMSINLE